MTIPSGSSYSPYAGGFGAGGGGMSAQDADAGLEASERKKRADGVKNAFKAAENANTSGIKSAVDALRL
ncbi:hypothetical protein C4J93_0746 [Pseudomonas sp. R2-37-08W]|uniref:hypothetical protein n=1 Tax=unclassified Pseudomonas TaxID=196821 RepID=UPI000F5680DA|nr:MULTISPECIES: hypothetical protein [unclassified Pseudomonas]AZF08966.1 hypothetical protein C4J93_0746 [Pseudomonas sp. R2-37-08W]AZF45988.1 hypothetical protein C4J86_0730 [Pseudomonas sp. R2-7-07]AZF56631.1 hypothetical protein C4J84_0732 [Pseudomonas sp. R11-23-07]